MSSLPFAKKNLGQHWLEDEISLQAMIRAGQISSNDTVLEIGPGTGTLTEQLILTGAKIIALEFDRQRFLELQLKFHLSSRVDIINGDIRTFDLNSLPKNYKIVANIPYYLTANLLRKLVNSNNKPCLVVLLVQKEVAMRINKSPGDLSQLAVFTQVYYQPSLSQVVPKNLFIPVPKVDSQILVLTRRKQPLVLFDEYFIKVVKAGFAEKRKKLYTSLSKGLSINKNLIKNYLAVAKINVNVRAQELSLQQWQDLSQLIKVDMLTVNK